MHKLNYNDIMLVYSVLNYDKKFIENLSKYNIYANNLIAFNEKGTIKNIKKIEGISQNILIDSGAFTLLKNEEKMKNFNLEKYLMEYISFIKKNKNNNIIQGYFELDLDKFIGYDKVLDIRDKLFEYTDKIIPVFHPHLGINEFKKLCENYEYIAIGGIALRKMDKNKLKPLINYAIKKDTKVHGLGLTSPKYLKTIPFYSVDSVTWKYNIYGQIGIFNKLLGKMDVTKPNSRYVTENYQKCNLINYIEQLKFQKYYKKYWEERGY